LIASSRTRYPVNCLFRRCHGRGVWLRPAKASRQLLEKILQDVVLGDIFIRLISPGIGEVWIVLAHGNLFPDIVREF
jgi:hypothetical protein